MTINLGTANEFIARHIGPRSEDEQAMLATLGFDSLEAMTDAVIPASIKGTSVLGTDDGHSEADALAALKAIAGKNQLFKSYIGQGYYNTHTPPPILRNLLENPAWYTAYTPYQPEISQGRLEALLNFQTLISDLTGLPIANASLLDEATASLDYESERLVHDNLASIRRGRTVLIVAHRLSTLRMADRVIVLGEGRLMEVGSHDELMLLQGTYRSLYDAHRVLEAV